MTTANPVLRRIHACVLAAVPAVLWSEPGTGKTAMIRTYVAARRGHCARWILSRCEPIDLKPRIYYEGRVIVSTPPEVEECRAAASEGRVTVLFADEMNRATVEVEGAFLDIADNPPEGVAILAACNPPSRGQAARPLGSAAANRFCHLEVETDPAAWARAQVNGWPAEDESSFPVPDAATMQSADIRARAVFAAFLQRRPVFTPAATADARGNARQQEPESTLEAPPSNPADAGKGWASARSWENARRLFAVALALDLDADDTIALVAGCIGKGRAVELNAFAIDTNLADPEELLADPESFTPPENRVDRTVAIVSSVVAAVSRNMTAARWEAAYKLFGRIEAAGQADACAVAWDLSRAALTEFAKRDPAGAKAMSQTHTMGAKYMPRTAKLVYNATRPQ